MDREECDPTEDQTTVTARALCDEGAQLREQGNYDVARGRYEQALTMLEATVTERSTTARQAQMACCLGGLGGVLMQLGDDAGAGTALERALAIQESISGNLHPDRAAILQGLGELRANRGDQQEAVALLSEALSIRSRVLGPGHAETLESTTVLALLLAGQGERAKAEDMLSEALTVSRRTLGERHRTTARILNAQGRLWARDEPTRDRAQAAYQQALSIYEGLLGPVHPWVAIVLSNLAALLADMRDYEAAQALLERSLAIHERVYGPDNGRTSFPLVNLADTLIGQGDQAAARPLLERALVIRERAWGAQHVETIRVLRKLVSVLGALQQVGDESAGVEGMALFPFLAALEAARDEHALASEGLPGSHLDSAQAAVRLHDLAGRLAEELARPPVAEVDRAALGTAQELARQADDHYAAGDYSAAAARLEEALHVQEEVLGDVHLDHVHLLEKLAQVLPRTGHYGAALPIHERIADIHLRVLGADHPMTVQARSRLWQQLEYEYGPAAALPLQEDMLASMEANVGTDDPFVIMARQSIERLRATVGQTTEASGPVGPSQSERREAALAAVSPEEQDLLAGLEAVDWHSLKHAYGPADDVPNLLRLLLAEDDGVRDSVWMELYTNLWHQGDVYQATSYAVPFLLRVLQAPDLPDKASILAFLQVIATGAPYLTESHTWMEAVLAEEGRHFQREIELARSYTQRAHDAVARGVDVYLDLLDDPVAGVREWAFALLCVLPEHAGRSVPALLARLRVEPEPDLRARLVEHLRLGLAGLAPDEGEGPVAELLEQLVRSGETGMVRFAAAVALASVLGPETPPLAVDILEGALVNPAGLHADGRLEQDDPAIGEKLVVETACVALSHIDAERRIAVLRRSLGQISQPDHAHLVAIVLLDSALLSVAREVGYSGIPEATEEAVYYALAGPQAAGGVQRRVYPRAEATLSPASLTPDQRQALQAVLDSPAVWAMPNNLLEIYGLLASPSAVRRLLQQEGS